jgi:hypothetical protein
MMALMPGGPRPPPAIGRLRLAVAAALSLVIPTPCFPSLGAPQKHIDWYVGHDWNWLSPRSSLARAAAIDFALYTHRDLVDGMFPSFVHLNCTTGSLPAELDFSSYAPFIAAGIEVSPTFEGTSSCCAPRPGACPLAENKEQLAQELLALALRHNLSGYTQVCPLSPVPYASIIHAHPRCPACPCCLPAPRGAFMS